MLSLLKKVHAALAPGGQAAIVEFVPNDDRVTPPGGRICVDHAEHDARGRRFYVSRIRSHGPKRRIFEGDHSGDPACAGEFDRGRKVATEARFLISRRNYSEIGVTY